MDWAAFATAVVLFFTVIIGAWQLRILLRQYRVENAPFIEASLEFAKQSAPTGPEFSKRVLDISELEEWATANPNAPNRFIVLQLENKQKNMPGIATSIKVRIVLRFPKRGATNTVIEVPRVIEGIWLRPEERFGITFANLKGLPEGTIDIIEITYYDIDRVRYRTGYGYSHWELNNTGVEGVTFRHFS